MPGTWDANIKLLYAVDDGGFFAIDTVNNGDSFDVIANVEIGANLMQVVTKHDLFMFVRNLSQSNILASQTFNQSLTPQNAPLNQEIRVNFPGGWNASEGDVLEVVTAYKVAAGVNSDYSSQKTNTFIVST